MFLVAKNLIFAIAVGSLASFTSSSRGTSLDGFSASSPPDVFLSSIRRSLVPMYATGTVASGAAGLVTLSVSAGSPATSSICSM